MKKIFVILLALTTMNILNSQNSNIADLMKIKEKLILDKSKIVDSISKIDIQVNYLKTLENNSKILGTDFIKTTVTFNASIKNKPSLFAEIIGEIPKGEFVEVYDYFDGFWSIKFDSIIGYTNDIFISNRRELNARRDIYNNSEILKRFGKEIGNKILSHQIWSGMTTEMAKLSVGNPKDINRTVGTWGIHEQWVYDNRYLYFENGELKSWQN
jgi:hypothetical protein